jgi:O-antigen/teichoic acid export membrane protein
MIRLWTLSLAATLAYSPGVAIARGLGRPWFEILSYASALLAHVGFAIVLVPRFGPSGAIIAAGCSFLVGFLVFVPLFHRRCRIPFQPWFRKELLPRLVAGVLTVVIGAGLLGLGWLSPHLPMEGWRHGILATVLFVTIFALLFIPVGDTQRVSQIFWQMTSGVVARASRVNVSRFRA